MATTRIADPTDESSYLFPSVGVGTYAPATRAVEAVRALFLGAATRHEYRQALVAAREMTVSEQAHVIHLMIPTKGRVSPRTAAEVVDGEACGPSRLAMSGGRWRLAE